MRTMIARAGRIMCNLKKTGDQMAFSARLERSRASARLRARDGGARSQSRQSATPMSAQMMLQAMGKTAFGGVKAGFGEPRIPARDLRRGGAGAACRDGGAKRETCGKAQDRRGAGRGAAAEGAGGRAHPAPALASRW